MQITFKHLQDNCRNQAFIKNGIKMCGKDAHKWDEWTECCAAMCPILNPPKKNVQLEGQIHITDILGETK